MAHQHKTPHDSAATELLEALTDDELADLAEDALERESKRRAELYDHEQAIALRHLRGVLSDLSNETPIECPGPRG